MQNKTIGIIGLGLIGGSIAKTIKSKGLDYEVIAYDRSIEMLELAKEEKIIDEWHHEVNDNFSKCNIIFLCAPVNANTTYLLSLKQHMNRDCILTDVGSVKGNIHDAIYEHKLEYNFIGGHPMAGSEKSGYTNSQAHLFENAYYILTPSHETTKEKIDILYNIVEQLGALPVVLDYKEHDSITASISHIPHIIASSLVQLIRTSDNEKTMKKLAAGGFKDITRIASSSPDMWQQISIANKNEIINILNKYSTIIKEFENALLSDNNNYIYDFFDTARDYRNTITNAPLGPIKKSYEVILDIVDETGIIAKIVAVLAASNISIKNIGIIHNREFEQGVLNIIFYDEESQKKSIDLLKKFDYKIYER